MEKNREEERLELTLSIAKKQLAQAKKTAEEKKEEILEAKRDVRENATHSVGNLWSSEDFEALIELSQCMDPVNECMEELEAEERKIFRLETILKKPYFARIDFRFDGEDDAEPIYIGRASLMEEKTRERYVYDWRSPIASVFYRFMTGEAFYEAPGGIIRGEVTLKRQYEIKDGILQYFFDTERNISDELLRQMLSQNTSPRMKAIVETIQREQDIAIRDGEHDLLMVQGVAGSGKTSIALHRAAYLMYQGLQNRLYANNILILSPNNTFENYISNVLPELGEENAQTVTFEELLAKLLPGKRIQSKKEFLERMLVEGAYKKVVKDSIEYKTSEEFRQMLEAFLAKLPRQWREKDVLSLYEKFLYGSRIEVWSYTQKMLEAGRIPYEDAIAVLYLQLRLCGCTKYQMIRQVVIDEAQDYYPLQYEIFRLLFPNAKFTVLGDINQTLAKSENMAFYENVERRLKRRTSALITLDKSFRCTNEILEFALQFVEKRPEITSFNRKGEKPYVTMAKTHKEYIDAIVKEAGVCIEQGYQTICLLCKTEKNARQLFQSLKSKLELRLITDRTTEDMQGVFLMPVYLSKGLEFDAVLICDVDELNYYEEDDKKLLYVACTRALHRLGLFGEKLSSVSC